MNNHLRYVLFAVLFVGISACKRGCTTTSTVESETTTISTPGGDLVIKASVIDYRNSRAINKNIFNRSVTHTYGVSIDLSGATWTRDDVFNESVPDPDVVDLDQQLARIKVAMSDDGNHVAMGVDGTVVEVVHLYKGEVIPGDFDTYAVGGLDWNDLDINSYPEPEEILLKKITTNCDFMLTEETLLFGFMDTYAPSDTMQREFLAQWPECAMMGHYIDSARIVAMSKDPTWYIYFKERVKTVLEGGIMSYKKEEVLEMISSLNDPNALAMVDELLIDSWGGFTNDGMNRFVMDRMKSKKYPMKANVKQQYLDIAAASFDDFLESGRSDSKKSTVVCLQMLQLSGDTALGHTFLHDAFGGNHDDYWFYDFLDVAYDNFDGYTKDQQAYILEQTPLLFEKVEDYEQDGFFRAVSPVLDCNSLKMLKQKYPEDLNDEDLPEKC